MLLYGFVKIISTLRGIFMMWKCKLSSRYEYKKGKRMGRDPCEREALKSVMLLDIFKIIGSI